MTQRIAVIEDDPTLLEMLRDLLEGAGFSVLALNRPEQIETLDPHAPPDLFLIDLSLPGVSGLEVARQLQNRGFARIPKIALSASCLFRNVAKGSHIFVRTMAKPFDTRELLAAIAEQVGRVRVWQSPLDGDEDSHSAVKPIHHRAVPNTVRERAGSAGSQSMYPRLESSSGRRGCPRCHSSLLSSVESVPGSRRPVWKCIGCGQEIPQDPAEQTRENQVVEGLSGHSAATEVQAPSAPTHNPHR